MRCVRAVAPTVALTVDELWRHLRAGAELTERLDLVDALDALARQAPPQGDGVLCHGDLHPFNLLRDGDRISVLDWTAALVAPPAYDVALTRLLLRYPPLAAPPAPRPIIGAGARALARRFVRRYRHANPTADLTNLDCTPDCTPPASSSTSPPGTAPATPGPPITPGRSSPPAPSPSSPASAASS